MFIFRKNGQKNIAMYRNILEYTGKSSTTGKYTGKSHFLENILDKSIPETHN